MTGVAFVAVIIYILKYHKHKTKAKEPVVYDYIGGRSGGIEMVSNLSYIQRVLGLPAPRKTRAEITPKEH